LLRVTNLNQPRLESDDQGYTTTVTPDPHFTQIDYYESSGKSSYHALHTHLTRRFTTWLQAEISYSWGKAIDDVANIRAGDIVVAIPNVKARSAFDRRHMLVANFIYEFPSVLKGKWQPLFGGWQVAGIFTVRTGAPLNIRQQNYISGFGESLPDVVGSFRQFDPRQVRTFRLPNGQVRTGNFFFDPTVFQVARTSEGVPRPGNLGRNVFSGPGINNWDMALLKRIRFKERLELELRLETSNVFNHTQFTSVSQQLHNLTFGQANSNDNARKVQVGAKLHF
jgi:hypothetical protein